MNNFDNFINIFIETINECRFKMSPVHFIDNSDGFRQRIRGLVVTFGCKGIEDICNRDDPALQRDCFSFQTCRISRSIPLFMVGKGNRRGHTQQGRILFCENIPPDGHVLVVIS